MNMKENNEKCELQIFKGTTCVDFGCKFKLKVATAQKAADLAMDLVTSNEISHWTMDDVAMFWVSTDKRADPPIGTDECFISGERLKNGSYSLEVKFGSEERTEEIKMPASEEKSHGVIYEDKDNEPNLKTYTVRVGVSYARENRDVLGYDAEDAACVLIRTAIHSEIVNWRSKDIISFFVRVDENENIDGIENVECSIRATRLANRSLEIIRITNGIEEVGKAFLYEDEIFNEE